MSQLYTTFFLHLRIASFRCRYVEDISFCRSVEHPCPTDEEIESEEVLVPRMKFYPIIIDPGKSVTETILTICNQVKMKALIGVVISSSQQYVHLSLASVAYHFGIPVVDFSPVRYDGYYTTVSEIHFMHHLTFIENRHCFFGFKR